MARVVQRRGGPPYVLILLAFLFLASTTLAVLFYVRNDESVKGLGEEKTKSLKLAKESREKTAVINDLVKKIAGRIVSPEAAKEEANQRLEGLKPDYGSLSSAIAGLSVNIADLESQIEKGKLIHSELRNEVARKEKSIGDIKQELTKQLKTIRDELTAKGKLYKKGLDNYKAEVNKANEEFKGILKQRDRRIDSLDAELGDKAMEIQRLGAHVARLQKIIRDIKGKAGSVGEWLVSKPSGKVAKVMPGQGICYINLGERDRVTAGLTFSVFSARTGIIKTTDKNGKIKPKAKIVIVNVGLTTSECRITKTEDKNDPIIEGDLIVNLVFSSTRTYNFVVEGEFDLYGTGRSDPLANRHVRAIIERFGGKVADEISISTDFVVMGDEPPRPPKPAEDAPPAVWKIYHERMKTYDYYRQVKAIAVSLQIPVLNTNRFLAYSGHVPKKRLVD